MAAPIRQVLGINVPLPLTLQVLLVPLPNATIYIFNSYLMTFPNYSLRTLKKKISGQVRPGHQSWFVDTTSEKLAIMSEPEFFTERFPLFRYS